MKTTNTIATLKEAQKGKAFNSIDKSTLQPFREQQFAIGESDKRYALTQQLREVAFPSLPAECDIQNTYSGILATDLFSLNTLLGSMIENQVVRFLNSRRHLWDDGLWAEYHFIRSSESCATIWKRCLKSDHSTSLSTNARPARSFVVRGGTRHSWHGSAGAVPGAVPGLKV